MNDQQYEKLVLTISNSIAIQVKHEAITSTLLDLMKPIIAKEKGISEEELQKLVTERILINQEASSKAVSTLLEFASSIAQKIKDNKPEEGSIS